MDIHLSPQQRWEQLSESTRLMEIAEYLRAECYEAMLLGESSNVSTKGD